MGTGGHLVRQSLRRSVNGDLRDHLPSSWSANPASVKDFRDLYMGANRLGCSARCQRPSLAVQDGAEAFTRDRPRPPRPDALCMVTSGTLRALACPPRRSGSARRGEAGRGLDALEQGSENKQISGFVLTLANNSPSVGGMGVLSSRPAGISTGDPDSLRAGALSQTGGRR